MSTWTDTHHQPADGGTRPSASGVLSLAAPVWRKRHLFLEVFAGSAVLSQACKDAGVDTSEPWDILIHKRFDLTHPPNVKKLIRLISSNTIGFLWIAPPCESYSSARQFDGRGPRPVRCAKDPTVPAPWCSDLEKQEVLHYNYLTDLTAYLVRLAHQNHVHFAIENPRRSMLWSVPSIRDSLADSGGFYVIVDFCMYGTPWQKSTAIATSLPALASLEKRCRCRNVCSRSGTPHIPLIGKAEDGRWLTSHACA